MKLSLNKPRYYIVIFSILVFDQISKLLIVSKLSEGESISLISGFLNFTYVKNDGAVWGLFSKNPNSWVPVLITLLSIVTLLVISYFFLKAGLECKYELTGLAFVLGGAIGNIIDRIKQGYVVDFIEMIFGSYHFPVYNVADSFISIGVCVLILSLWKGKCPSF